MKTVSVMDLYKETDNKLRWQAWEDGVLFELYIPKWRVPEPWPARIAVTIDDDPNSINGAAVAVANSRVPDSVQSRNLSEPIVVRAARADFLRWLVVRGCFSGILGGMSGTPPAQGQVCGRVRHEKDHPIAGGTLRNVFAQVDRRKFFR